MHNCQILLSFDLIIEIEKNDKLNLINHCHIFR